MAAPDALSNNHDKNGAFNFEKFYKSKNGFQHKSEGKYDEIQQNPASVWAMDCEEGLIILGCANGRIEVWETMSCQFKVIIFFLIFSTFSTLQNHFVNASHYTVDGHVRDPFWFIFAIY